MKRCLSTHVPEIVGGHVFLRLLAFDPHLYVALANVLPFLTPRLGAELAICPFGDARERHVWIPRHRLANHGLLLRYCLKG
jgi:hypothetical protein